MTVPRKESVILAVLLAINEREGHKLVFWYPPVPTPLFMAAPKYAEEVMTPAPSPSFFPLLLLLLLLLLQGDSWWWRRWGATSPFLD